MYSILFFNFYRTNYPSPPRVVIRGEFQMLASNGYPSATLYKNV